METEYQQFVRREISKPTTATTSKKNEEQSLTSLHGISQSHLEQDMEKKYVYCCFSF